jgi:hypothetical protein
VSCLPRSFLAWPLLSMRTAWQQRGAQGPCLATTATVSGKKSTCMLVLAGTVGYGGLKSTCSSLLTEYMQHLAVKAL